VLHGPDHHPGIVQFFLKLLSPVHSIFSCHLYIVTCGAGAPGTTHRRRYNRTVDPPKHKPLPMLTEPRKKPGEWTPEELEDGRKFMHRLNQSRELAARRAARRAAEKTIGLTVDRGLTT
jgi:hypothetical protein